MRAKETINYSRGLLVDPIPNSLNKQCKNCTADSKENYYYDFRSERVCFSSSF